VVSWYLGYEHVELVRSTWRTWKCFPVLQLRCALILRELNQIFIACLFKGSQKQSFFLQTLLFTAFLMMVLKMWTYALVSTWSLVSSGYEHIPQLMQPWCQQGSLGFRAVGRRVKNFEFSDVQNLSVFSNLLAWNHIVCHRYRLENQYHPHGTIPRGPW